MTNPVNSIVIHRTDDVATALVKLNPGDSGRYVLQGEICEVAVADMVPKYHKFALRDIAASEPVYKYGEVIGKAIQPICKGAHVHVHNIVSLGSDTL